LATKLGWAGLGWAEEQQQHESWRILATKVGWAGLGWAEEQQHEFGWSSSSSTNLGDEAGLGWSSSSTNLGDEAGLGWSSSSSRTNLGESWRRSWAGLDRRAAAAAAAAARILVTKLGWAGAAAARILATKLGWAGAAAARISAPQQQHESWRILANLGDEPGLGWTGEQQHEFWRRSLAGLEQQQHESRRVLATKLGWAGAAAARISAPQQQHESW
jgi:hypothetical protein